MGVEVVPWRLCHGGWLRWYRGFAWRLAKGAVEVLRGGWL